MRSRLLITCLKNTFKIAVHFVHTPAKDQASLVYLVFAQAMAIQARAAIPVDDYIRAAPYYLLGHIQIYI